MLQSEPLEGGGEFQPLYYAENINNHLSIYLDVLDNATLIITKSLIFGSFRESEYLLSICNNIPSFLARNGTENNDTHCRLPTAHPLPQHPMDSQAVGKPSFGVPFYIE